MKFINKIHKYSLAKVVDACSTGFLSLGLKKKKKILEGMKLAFHLITHTRA